MDFHMQRRQGPSIHKIAEINGVSRNTVRRALRSLTPPDGKRQRSQGDKLAPFHEQSATWLRDPVKSHWTGARMLDGSSRARKPDLAAPISSDSGA